MRRLFLMGRGLGPKRQPTAYVILTGKETGSVAPAKAGAYLAFRVKPTELMSASLR
jgi:hypothetical protein